MKYKKVECGLGHYHSEWTRIVCEAKEGNYVAVFRFNGITIKAFPDSRVEDLHKIYMLKRRLPEGPEGLELREL